MDKEQAGRVVVMQILAKVGRAADQMEAVAQANVQLAQEYGQLAQANIQLAQDNAALVRHLRETNAHLMALGEKVDALSERHDMLAGALLDDGQLLEHGAHSAGRTLAGSLMQGLARGALGPFRMPRPPAPRPAPPPSAPPPSYPYAGGPYYPYSPSRSPY